MGKLIWILGLWLVGIAPAMALDMNTPEMLRYKVYWGFVRVGTAQLDYVPGPDNYVLRALVKDTSSLIDMDDSWESRGSHTAAKPFMPSVYSIKQAENSYRADKTMTFDVKSKTVVYANKIDPTDKAEPLPLGDARDVLATVYAWRMGGLETVKQPGETQMVSLKRFLTLKRGAGAKTRLSVGDKTYDVWRVQLTTVKDTGKTGKDVWTVYVTDDANLTPVQIVASTKFGTFKAVLVP